MPENRSSLKWSSKHLLKFGRTNLTPTQTLLFGIAGATTTTHPDINMPSVAFMDNSIDIYQQSYQSRNFVWQFTFYRRGTNTPISVPFHANFKDIDNTEILGHGYSGIDGVYVMSRGSGGNLSYNSSQVYAPSELSGDDVRQNWATLIGVASSFRLGYTRRLVIEHSITGNGPTIPS